ncbi:MAG: DUF499 domain-containing protein [Chloroflexi bacterium]|nr:DUF499 domain-containing protein [Chloroflexota bacterium]
MSGEPWIPWHQVVALREDVRSGDFSLSAFAADLYAVAMGERAGESDADRAAQRIYRDCREFFARTYPTFNLRELVKTVLLRLAGRSDKAVQQLELTYGGGKTHTLITLFHLVDDPVRLPRDLPAVQEFISHAGLEPPPSRVATLAFDKLDVEKGMEVRAPDGAMRWLRQPWSILAYELGGDEGLRLLHPEERAEERETAPAQNLLEAMLRLPQHDGLATLVLIDEVLMYAREKVGADPVWQGRLVNFFQYLTQAATQVGRCAIVASLLASDPRMNDELGNQIAREIATIFRRELSDQGVQPVVRDDVAEVLRRRFFTAESLRDRDAYRPHVVTALQGITALDETTAREGMAVEERYLRSYPFHPDLTEVFYSKWTQIRGFQRTRGVLRTFALALRDAVAWDAAPLVSTNVFLAPPVDAGDTDVASLANAAEELTTIATQQEAEDYGHNWAAILGGELAKARQIQRNDTTGLTHRELEQVVLVTFLHSQPITQKASTRDLLVLVGHTRPDRIELEKALQRWCELSWFLDEAPIIEARRQSGNAAHLPSSWRLGLEPNLRQIHFVERERVTRADIDVYLLAEIQRTRSLTAEAPAAGAHTHLLPQSPRDVADDGEFHYVVLGPSAAADSGRASPEASRYLNEHTPDKPRIARNALVLTAPSTAGLEHARETVKDYLAWDAVSRRFTQEELSEARRTRLRDSLDAARRAVPEAIRQAYCIVVTLGATNSVEAFRVAVVAEPLFRTIKEDRRARIQETAITADALLPDGPYQLWRSGETARRVSYLVGAFAELPQLPKMLRRQAILDTLVAGCRDGAYVLQTIRPDRTARTFWRQQPDAAALADPTLELVLPEAATLSSLDPVLLPPGALPDLWDGGTLAFQRLLDYFSGNQTVTVHQDGFDQMIAVPRAERSAVEAAVHGAVKRGLLWLTSNGASVYHEPVPAGLPDGETLLHAPPAAISYKDLLPEMLPQAWQGEVTSAQSIADGLRARTGLPLPWTAIAAAITSAVNAYALQLTPESRPWPAGSAGAGFILLRQPAAPEYPRPAPAPASIYERNSRVAEAQLSPDALQDLSDQLPALVGAVAEAGNDHTLFFRLTVELTAGSASPAEDLVTKLNALLAEVSDRLKLT